MRMDPSYYKLTFTIEGITFTIDGNTPILNRINVYKCYHNDTTPPTIKLYFRGYK